MPKPITVPKLGLTMRKATIVKWLRNEGEAVSRDKPVALIETEKVSAEVQAPEDGILLKVFAPRGTVVQVGAVIGFVGQPGDPIPEVRSESSSETPASPTMGAQDLNRSATADITRRRISPRAKMLLAEQKGLDLSGLVGTGPGEMIMERDVTEFISNSLYKTALGLKVKEVVPMSTTRKAIAENMVRSVQSMAQVTLTADVVASELEREIHSADRQEEDHPTYTDILVMVVASVLESHPMLNSTLENDQIKVIEPINIGVAVAVETGLVVPVIKDADKKGLTEISTALRELSEKARRGALSLDDISGGTFTITNLGSYGVNAFTPIINPPQSAILGVGKIAPRPTVDKDGKMAIKSMMTLSLTFDHRVMDGHTAALFLKALQEAIELPSTSTE